MLAKYSIAWAGTHVVCCSSLRQANRCNDSLQHVLCCEFNAKVCLERDLLRRHLTELALVLINTIVTFKIAALIDAQVRWTGGLVFFS